MFSCGKKISQENLCFFFLFVFVVYLVFARLGLLLLTRVRVELSAKHICLIIYLITRQHDALLLLPRLHLAAVGEPEPEAKPKQQRQRSTDLLMRVKAVSES